MLKNIKCRIYPSKIQRRKFRHIFTLCRYAYNRMLEIWEKEYKRDNKNHELISIKELRNKYPILKKVNSTILVYERNYLRHAIKRFFKKISKYPRYHSDKNDRDSFGYYDVNKTTSRSIKILNNDKIFISMFGIFSYSAKYNLLKYKDLITSIVIFHNKHNQYFITILIDDNNTINKPIKINTKSKAIGFDYDNPKTFVDSNGDSPNIRFYRDNEKRINKLNELMSKYRIRTKKWYKYKHHLSQLYLHIANKRKDVLYKLAKEYVTNYDILVFEDINLQHMSDSSKEIFINDNNIPIKIRLGKGIHDNGFGLFRNRIEQLCNEYGKVFIKVSMNYNSSQICSKCKNEKIGEERIRLNEKIYKCDKCGLEIDRDYNAAINIRDKGKEMIK